jgi:hypothetical protein
MPAGHAGAGAETAEAAPLLADAEVNAGTALATDAAGWTTACSSFAGWGVCRAQLAPRHAAQSRTASE